MKFNEHETIEKPVIAFLEKRLGYEFIPAEEFSKLRELEREYIVVPLLREAVLKLNEGAGEDEVLEVIRKVKGIEKNEDFLEILRYGVDLVNAETRKTKNFKLVDFEDIKQNSFVVTNQFYFEGNAENVRPDILVFLNGIPVVDIEAKSRTAEGVSVENAIGQLKRYEKYARNLFVPNCFNIVTDGFETRYGATYAPTQYFFEWKDADLEKEFGGNLEMSLYSLLEPARLLDIIQNFIVFEQTKDGSVKKVARYQQLRAANKIIERVSDGKKKRGLIWHWQGSGKSLTMFFAAWKLRFDKKLNNPKVFVIVDRVDLDDQIFEVFMNCGGKNVERITSRQDLSNTIANRDAGIFITTVQKFDEIPPSVKDENENVIVLTDESHRTQYGEFGLNARVALPNAFFFGFTGTPTEKTHKEFGVTGEKNFERYLDYYSIKQAIEDKATVPVTYEARLSKFAVDEKEIDAQFDLLTADLSQEEKQTLIGKFGRKEALIKLPKRMQAVAQDIYDHFRLYVAPSGFKAQVVCYDRAATAQYKEIFDSIMPKEYSEVVYSPGDPNMDSEELKKYIKTKQQTKDIIERFKNPNDPLKFLLVCDMLLTGFDAPVEQVMYLDKSLWGHNLLQAIARTNRVEKGKDYGKIIDYYGITRSLTEALDFDEREIDEALTDIANIKEKFVKCYEEILELFSGIDTEDASMANLRKCLKLFEGNIQKQETLEKDFKKLRAMFELLSPDPFLKPFVRKVEWLACFYVAHQKEFKTPEINARQLVAEYGPKLRQLVQERVDYEGITKNYRELRIDQIAEMEQRYGEDDETKAKNLERLLKAEISINIDSHPIFKSFAEKLEAVRKEFEAHQLSLSERIKKYEELFRDIKTSNEKAKNLGLNLKEYALYGFSEECIKEKQPAALVEYVKEMAEYLNDVLEPLWQGSFRREDLLKDVKRKIQQLALQDYKDKLEIMDFAKYLNRLTDIIIKKF